jgi:hypothetical protein
MVRSEQWWRSLLADQVRSGRTVAECCDAAGVHVASFYRWKRLLAQSALTATAGVRRKSGSAEGSPRLVGRQSDFLPVTIKASAARSDAAGATCTEQSVSADLRSFTGGVRVELPNGVVIHVSAEIDGQRLGELVIAAGKIPCASDDSAVRHVTQRGAASC